MIAYMSDTLNEINIYNPLKDNWYRAYKLHVVHVGLHV